MASRYVTNVTEDTVPDFDPAIHTLLFDIMLLWSYVGRRETSLCRDCLLEVLGIAERAAEGRIIAAHDSAAAAAAALLGPVSNIIDIWQSGQENIAAVYLATTFTGAHRPIDFFAAVRARQRLDYLESYPQLVDRFIEHLWPLEGAGDGWTADQCKLWFAVAGTYSVPDAAAGRDVAGFADNHRALMNHLVRAGPAGRCARNCFSLGVAPEMYGYPFAGDVERQSQVVYLRCLEMMDEQVRQIVIEVVEDTAGDGAMPLTLREDGDRLRMLKGVVDHPAVRARFGELSATPECANPAAIAERGMEAWRQMVVRDPTGEEQFGEACRLHLTRENFMRLARWFPRALREELEG